MDSPGNRLRRNILPKLSVAILETTALFGIKVTNSRPSKKTLSSRSLELKQANNHGIGPQQTAVIPNNRRIRIEMEVGCIECLKFDFDQNGIQYPSPEIYCNGKYGDVECLSWIYSHCMGWTGETNSTLSKWVGDRKWHCNIHSFQASATSTKSK